MIIILTPAVEYYDYYKKSENAYRIFTPSKF